MVTHSVTPEGVSLKVMGGAGASVVHLEAWPQSFAGDLNVCGAVDECISFLTLREVGLAKRKGRNHNHGPTIDIFKQTALGIVKKSTLFKKKKNAGPYKFSVTQWEKRSSIFRLQHVKLLTTLIIPLLYYTKCGIDGELQVGGTGQSRLVSPPQFEVFPLGLKGAVSSTTLIPEATYPHKLKSGHYVEKKCRIGITCWVMHIALR